MMTSSEWFAQSGARCRLEWGWQGAKTAAERGDILVVVDVLSFSTAATTAIQHGGILYPCRSQEEAEEVAKSVGGEAAVHRRDVPKKGRYSLSPLTYEGLEAGMKIALPSPNGATCCTYGKAVPALYVGALVNAQAVARTVARKMETSEQNVTVLACGERWHPPTLDGALRFALEDYLGTGAILSHLPYSKSPEALACEAAFLGVRSRLTETLWECGSGIELRKKGYETDVQHAAQLDLYSSVPMLHEDALERDSPDA
jgi:2-phosphosulfolactate phosphatase